MRTTGRSGGWDEFGLMLATGVVGVALAVVLIVAASLIRGYVLAVLWRWFVVAPFGVRPLGIAEAIGLCLVVRVLVPFDATGRPKAEESPWLPILRTFGAPAIVLASGYVVRWFMV